MSKTKINVFTASGVLLGYFVDPQVEAFAQGDYEISGCFYDANGQVVGKVEFNPQSVPYFADLSLLDKAKHKRLKNVYVQRGRQPVKMSGCGENSPVTA
jgi:hypothetical protein